MEKIIVIYGFSNVAQEIALTLKEKNHHVIIVEPDKNLCEEASSLGYETKNLSLMNDQNIEKLDLHKENIIAFFCLSDNKNTNLFVTLSVRNIVKDIKIISVAFSKDDNKAVLLAGADKIINPYEIGALRIFQLLQKPYILDVLDNILFSESNIEVAEITIPQNSIYDGTYINDLSIIQECNVILLGIQDKEISKRFIFYSKGINHKIDMGDTLVVLGKNDKLQQFKNHIFEKNH